MDNPAPLADRRSLFPEVIAFGAPRGFREQLRARARQGGTTVSALVRQALEQEMSAAAGPASPG